MLYYISRCICHSRNISVHSCQSVPAVYISEDLQLKYWMLEITSSGSRLVQSLPSPNREAVAYVIIDLWMLHPYIYDPCTIAQNFVPRRPKKLVFLYFSNQESLSFVSSSSQRSMNGGGEKGGKGKQDILRWD